ncbi:MAG TPA: prephenate dehydratase [Gemmatimonadaceae bacterium]|nr:prephenate dehydratase [Gemmatimonadaceae bacterium]
MSRVAFQGELGAFSEEAVQRAFGLAAEPIPCRENRDVAREVARAKVDAGVLPVENTLAGSVPASYDAILAEPSLHIVREVVIPIHHCILGLRGATLDTLRTVESHPIALAQCATWFAAHPSIHQRAAYDTAGAARDVAAAEDPSRGALASRIAASRYGLALLAENVEDRGDNQTRFVVLERAAIELQADTPAKTVLMLEVDNRPGSLVRILTPLSNRGLNLTKLESRPTGEPWSYHFVLEFEHRADDPAVTAALRDVEHEAARTRVVGTYARD